MAKTIELECPSCSEQLELDAGFAGGVCRCSECGTLMTVPVDPSHEQAERLTRPDRPDAPGGAPARPESPAPSRPEAPGRPETPAEAEAEAPAEPETAAPEPAEPAPQPTPEAAPPAEEPGVITYTTASGKTIRVDEASIPTAPKKRMGVRIATAVIFFGIIGLVVLLCIGAVVIMVTNPFEPEDPGVVRLRIEDFPFDPYANPLQLDKPNVLGLSLRDGAHVIIDASSDSSRWIEQVKHAVARGLSRGGSGARVNLTYVTPGGPKTLQGGAVSLDSLSETELQAFHSEIKAGGTTKLADAFNRAVNDDAKQVVLITGRSMRSADVEPMADFISPGNKVLVDVLLIDADSPALQRLSSDHGGRFALIRRQRLAEWADEAEASP